jgi:hypothetical protein
MRDRGSSWFQSGADRVAVICASTVLLTLLTVLSLLKRCIRLDRLDSFVLNVLGVADYSCYSGSLLVLIVAIEDDLLRF